MAATLALMYPGAPVAQVDLNDGAVWLTNTSQQKLGRFNMQIEELNAGLVATTSDFDVLQDAQDVLLVEPGKVSAVDPAGVVLAGEAAVPFGAQVSMAAGTVAVSVPGSGGLWVGPVSMVGALGSETPHVELGEGGVAVVGEDGTVVGASVDGTLHEVSVVEGSDAVDHAEDGTLSGLPDGGVPGFDQATTVGTDLVVLVGTQVHTPSGSTDLAAYGTDLLVQQPGPQASQVLVATPDALLEVPLDGGDVREHRAGGSGRPAAPVRVGSCAHGAWASATGNYLQLCDGSDARAKNLEEMTTSDELKFRVNRDVVVLNDTSRGRLWVPLEDPRLREPNWQDIEPDEEIEEDDDDSDATQATQNLQAECTADSSSPLAADDEFGVRPGRTTILSVIDNDTSSDCGILTISEHDPIPEDFGTLVPVYGGRALQLTTTPGATGTVDLTYTINDGRGSSAPSTAEVRLTARPDSLNEPPVQLRTGTVLVEQGASATYDLLPDFRDPDGDHLVLVGASVDSGSAVRTRQNGELTFVSDGADLGRQLVTVQVSDGIETVDGIVNVDVRPAGSLAPLIDPVHAETYVDQPVTVRPLASVRSATREPVRLAGVDDHAEATVEPDLTAGTFSFTAPRPGTYYVSFLVTASPQEAAGLARIDVLEQPETTPPPVAVLDVALLPPGGEVTIDPLANDVDPAGGVMVLQSVEVPEGTGLRAAVLNHRLVRFTSTRVLEGPVVASYTVSNGVASVTGEILVQPVPAAAGQQAPVVPDVVATVRTGGVVTIRALQDAYDPDGDPLTLQTTLAEPLASGQGLMFVSGDTLRYQAPATPMEVHATFVVTDPSGNATAASVTVRVHPSDPEDKALPRPENLTARVFEGGTVRIPVPLVGIDRDGDGVYLLGPDVVPSKGRIVAIGADWMDYEALPGELGTDEFTYAVEDWVGQRAVARVRVGIAPRPTTAAAVVARDDDVTVRPGQRVEVRVLGNDVDTSGGELTLAEELDVEEGVEARVEGRRVVVQTPESSGVVQVGYTATNDRGGRDTATLTVTVSDDAPFLPPVARDVVVPAVDTINRSTVEVDVLEVADNPSGPRSDLEVSVHRSAGEVASVTEAGRVLVQLTTQPQSIPYRLTNTHPQAEGVNSLAFITVPALGDFPPVRRPRAPELRVVAGERLEISLDEQIQVAPGRSVRVEDASRVTATRADGSPLVVNNRTLQYTAQQNYAGPASISVQVTDALPGAEGRTSVVTLPITVLAAEAYPPTFSPSTLTVGPGEVTVVDLRVFTSTPVGTAEGLERYAYSLTSQAPRGFSVSLDGTQLTVQADPTVPRGTVGGVGVQIAYGGSSSVTGQVEFQVTASSRRLANVVDHQLEGVEGNTHTVAVLDGASNPFPGEPLTVVGAVVETPGAGDASVSGQGVAVRPAAGFIGTMVTRYRVRDVTGDPDREVEGRIRMTVRGRPDVPRAPRVGEVRDRTVVLSWDAPANNGSPITGYRVTAQPGGNVRECASTTCTIDGLTNDVEYSFTVAARNAIDWSDPSPASAPARPDAVPGAPGSPSLVFGDRQIAASWSAPDNPGSAITAYTVEISPANQRGQSSFTTSSTSTTLPDLANGTSYAVRVRAQNRAPDPGPWSGWTEDTPAGVPAAPSVTATRVDDALGGKIDVRWTPGATNGDAIRDYELVISGGPNSRTVGGLTGTSYAFTDAANGVQYTFAVRAANKAGRGSAGSASSSAFGAPAGVSGLQANPSSSADPGAGTIDLSWPAPSDRGSRITGYEVEVNGSVQTTVGGTSHRLTGLTGGQAVSVRVRAVNEAGKGEWSGSRSATPVTRPGQVGGVSLGEPVRDGGNRPTRVDVTWDAPGNWGGRLVSGVPLPLHRRRQPEELARGGQPRDAIWPVHQPAGARLLEALDDGPGGGHGVLRCR
ncbi:fibronectin type III domain-containing protein [Actinotalea sp. BY-33]|uniref:Fibronectin type III domain-containing protein n=1 Tax=Actinotalea soli TaxID=2819234 RepID=A0A939RWQ4_9CELL|nr:fibronectin type III domain-containing protein [Actinotalea soli]MBO1752411.1 fibronectin type III domain-containing protein [Actinotalea soli]